MSVAPSVASFQAVHAGGEEGLTTDIRVCDDLDCRLVPVATAVIAAGIDGVASIAKAPDSWLEQFAAEITAPRRPAASRIAFVADRAQAGSVRRLIEARSLPWVVCALETRQGGEAALDAGSLSEVSDELFPVADVVIVRAGDLELYGGGAPDDVDGAKRLAKRLRERSARRVLVAGLGWRGRVLDLIDDEGLVTVLDAPRMAAARVPGIAGAHAMALACHVARGAVFTEAAAAAQRYIALRLQRGR